MVALCVGVGQDAPRDIGVKLTVCFGFMALEAVRVVWVWCCVSRASCGAVLRYVHAWNVCEYWHRLERCDKMGH